MLLLAMMNKMTMMGSDQDVISEGDMDLEVLNCIESDKSIATDVAGFEVADLKNDSGKFELYIISDSCDA